MRLIDLNVSIKLDNNEKAIKLLNDGDYDIIALQEVMRGIDSSVYDRYNNSKIIKESMNEQYKYSFFGALWVAKHHIKNGVITKDFGGLAEQGNEIISKCPIVEAENIFFYKNYAPFVDVTNFREVDHPRALERVVLQLDNKKVQLLNIHGIWNKGKVGDKRTIKECEFVLKVALDKEMPTIITGDFNLNPESESIKLINEKLKNLIDIYDIKPTRPIVRDGLDVGDSVDDYIFVNDKIKVKEFKVMKTDVSDNYPLILDFDIVK